MDDDQIYQRGGDEHDVEEYAKSNGADPETAFSHEMLDIIDNRDEFSRGDLQGILKAVFNKYFNQK